MDNTKNVIGLTIFIIILLLFSIGGYFFMNYMLDDFSKRDDKDSGITELKEIRIDPKKDYIYYENTVDILHEEHITSQDVVINIKGFENINNTLRSELASMNTKKVSIDENTAAVCSNEANLYSFPYREYTDTIFANYISLVINDFTYNCETGNRIDNIKGYVIDKSSGDIITEEELLQEFNITEDAIIEQIRKRLEDTQVLDGDTQVIDIDGTINDIRNGQYGEVKSLSISKTGDLVINFIVKSNKINYNDSIELN